MCALQSGLYNDDTFQETNFRAPLRPISADEAEKLQLRYYDSQMHAAAFILPRFMRRVSLKKAVVVFICFLFFWFNINNYNKGYLLTNMLSVCNVKLIISIVHNVDLFNY